jgi:UDP-N-acetylmuramoyl-tripeptide--D-alanyl-D-alanine ligase
VIPLTLAEVAVATGGRLDAGADPEAVVGGRVTLDSRSIGPGDLFVALAGQRVDGHDFAVAAVAAGAVAVLAARPVGVPAVLVDDPVVGLGRLARAVRDRLEQLTVIGITGSSGKTSTKDLLAAVLPRAGRTIAAHDSFNNELGVPLTTLRADAETRFLILEMGARGRGHIGYLCEMTHPDIGVVLNIGTAHVGEFGTQEATAQAKGELVEALPPAGLAVLNADDPLVAAMASRTRGRVTFTAVGEPAATGGEIKAEVKAERVQLDGQARARFDLVTSAGTARVQLAVLGEHQVANALAAAAVGLEVGLSPAEVAQALSAAGAASRWRMEVRTRADGLIVVNDAYNANPDSVTAALRALVAMSGATGEPVEQPAGAAGEPAAPERHYWAVLGEMLELGPESAAKHAQIGRLAAELGLTGLIAVGPGAAPIAEAAGASSTIQVFTADDVDQALALVQQNVGRADVVLIKASRSVGLERVADGLLTAL